jgi:chromosome partitioning protein
MSTVLAVANQKGGVGKTTTTHSLGEALSMLGARVMLVDLDPQACLTYAAGLDPENLEASLHDVITGRATSADVVTVAGRCSILPSSIDLAGSEIALATKVGREHALARALTPVRSQFDVVLVDCPPSLGILTINGLTAANAVLIPLQCETLSHRGVGQLLETIADVRAYTQPDLAVLGAIPTMFDGRSRHPREIAADVTSRYGITVFDPPVPRSIRFAEAPASGTSIFDHAPTSRGADAYRALAQRVLDAIAVDGDAAPRASHSDTR